MSFELVAPPDPTPAVPDSVDAGRPAPAGDLTTRAPGPENLPDPTALQSWFRLTEREAVVALLLAQRLTAKEIARSLDVTPYTARRHTERVLAKLGIGCRRDVLARITAGQHGSDIQGVC